MSIERLLNGRKRLVLISLLIVYIAFNFWTGSRYPSLENKAAMGGETNLEDPLSFDAMLPLQADFSTPQRIAYITLNWINTNRQGMTFGILLGAGVLTLLAQLRRKSYRNGFANSLMGFLVGTPLGVCVNCAAPIAKGLHDAGARLETTLTAMFSSPTMNVIVLTMLISIFPPYMAVIKIAATLILVLLLIPLLCRYVFRNETQATTDAVCCVVQPVPPEPTDETWLKALLAAGRAYLTNLWYLIRTTVPLMLLAGFLGAVFVTLMPLQSFSGMEYSLAGLLLVVLLGTLLPVPMAFDIVVVAALLATGVPEAYAMALLFTLGSFSIYPMLIVWRSISARVALTLFITVACIGAITAVIAHWHHNRDLENMFDTIEQISHMQELPARQPRTWLDALIPSAHAETLSAPPGLRIAFEPFATSAANGNKPFTQLEGDKLGLVVPNEFSVADYWPPFYYGRGLAAGDVHNDGWPDVVFALESGVILFRNEQGQRFSPQHIDIPALKKLDVFMVALVDIDNDGWLDLYLTAYQDGNYTLRNDQGSFRADQLRKVQAPDHVLTLGLAFGDIDLDGDLDGVMGNWFYGWPKQVPPAIAQNYLLFNEGGTYQAKALAGITGETLSILISDINADRKPDLIVGNDFVQPDIFYYGDGKGGFKEINRADGVIPISTTTTMSIDTADIDNDLDLEMYIAQIAAGTSASTMKVKDRHIKDYCDDVTDPTQHQRCRETILIRKFYQFDSRHKPSDIQGCRTLKDPAERRACASMMVLKTALKEQKPAICEKIPAEEQRIRSLCTNFFQPGVKTTRAEYQRSIPQDKNQNVLLVPNDQGGYDDKAPAMKVEIGAWSWNAKFADLDHDGWQDIYLVNGALRRNVITTNLFFRNQQGKTFSEDTEAFGLDNYMLVSAYAYLDMDRDGDLDIISNSVNGPGWIFINNNRDGHAIAFDLRDAKGNHYGIGSKVIIHYGDKGELHQIRELKSGGGFVSFDEPMIHFGLGEHDAVKRIEIHWSTGETSTLEGPFRAGGRYRISRDLAG